MRNRVRLCDLDTSKGAANPMLFTGHASINRINFPFIIENETYSFSHACQLLSQIIKGKINDQCSFFNSFMKKKKIK